MKKYPKNIFYRGKIELLEKRKVSIVGSRKPNRYARELTYELAEKLSSVGVVVVSGAAMGIDASAHRGAKSSTIAVMANGLDIIYPAVNRSLIEDMEVNSLVLSSYEEGTYATKYSFVHRNEIVVALGEALIVSYADLNSGSMRSVEYAEAMSKPIYVFPHRLKESEATNMLLREGRAQAIYDIDKFVSKFGLLEQGRDEFLEYCKTNPPYEEALLRYSDKIFEYERDGKIKVTNGKIYFR